MAKTQKNSKSAQLLILTFRGYVEALGSLKSENRQAQA